MRFGRFVNSNAGSHQVDRRVWLIPLILAIEMTAAVQVKHPWFTMYLFRGVPAFFPAALLFFGRGRFQSFGRVSLRPAWAAVHALLVVAITALEGVLLRLGPSLPHTLYIGLGACWALLLLSLVPSLLLTFFPGEALLRVARRLGPAWGYAALSSAALILAMEALHRSWSDPDNGVSRFFERTAFNGARGLLSLMYPDIVSDAPAHVLGTDRFQIDIGATCSGVQGLALLTVLLLTWAVYQRKRLIPGRVLMLGCVALPTLWALNIVRLAALIAIGDAGHPQVAINGFHTEAGWIAMNGVALGFLILMERVPWFQRAGPATLGLAPPVLSGAQRTERLNLPAVFLGPFLAITAASVLSHAASGGFEWFYPLRFVAALAVLWAYRREYRRMDLRFGWLGVGAGLAVAVLWIALYHLQAHPGQASSPHSFFAPGMTRTSRSLWIGLRILAAITTVPLAEELAFRGFLARRVVSPDFNRVSYGDLSHLGLALSAILFGLVHGSMWGPGIAAGAAFGLVAKYRNRLGEAVAAHAVANLGLALWVLTRGDYGLW